MNFPAYLRSLAARLLHSSRTEADLEEEVRAHIQHRTDDLVRSGLDRAEAERRASIEFGGRLRFREEMREEISGNFLETALQDLRYSLRLLRKSPGFTSVAVATLALAIGANAVVFGVLNGVLLRPLNVPQPQSLYMIERERGNGYESYPDYIDIRDRNRTFDGLAAFGANLVGFDAGDQPSRSWGIEASGNYFDVLRLQPHLGRFFHASDEHGPNSAPYIVLSYAFWQSRFQGDRGAVGRTVQLNKHPFTIVGVAPQGFHGTLLFFSPDFFVPMVNREQLSGQNFMSERANRTAIFDVIGHLKEGVTPAQAIADLNAIGAYLEKTYPKDDGHVNFGISSPSLYGNYLGPPVRAFLSGLSLLSGLILLAACANLGSLFAARASDRSREVALRLALGAKRTRILRTLFTEALLLALAGGSLGLWASVALLRGMSAWQPVPRFPVFMPVSPDAKVYLIALALAFVSGALFGLVPVRQVLRTDPYQIIKAGAVISGRRWLTPRDVLIGAQIAICAVLVTSSIVAVRGLNRSLHSEFGFDPRNAMLAELVPGMAGYRGPAVPALQKKVIQGMQSIPGVESVGAIDVLPLYADTRDVSVFADDATDFRPSNALAQPAKYAVSPEYLHTAGTALLAGRVLSSHDDENSPRVAVVNQELARRIFGRGGSAVGQYFKLRNGTRVQVVGVVQDGKYQSLTENPTPAVFLPLAQSPANDMWLVVRSQLDPGQLAPALRGALHDIDASLPSYVSPWSKELDNALFPSRMASIALGVLGMLGAILSVTGIFGMAAYSVSKRLKELGIRIALGAQPKSVLQAALGRALRLLAFGSAAGLVLGLLATRILAAIVYHATPRDPLVLSGVVFAMLLVGLLATWIPARRALSADPAALLREE